MRVQQIEGIGSILRVPSSVLTSLSYEAFTDVEHLLRPSHLQQLNNILSDKDSSDNDKTVALQLLKNACVAAGRYE